MREQMRDRLADESAEQRETRLQQMRDHLADESAEQREARLKHMREQMRNRLADESAEQREVRLQQMSDSQRERMAAETIKLCYHFFIFIHSHRFNLINLSPPPPETLHYIHLFIQLDSFTICTLVYIIITILFLHLHFTIILFRQTTNSACAHQLRLTPQYDMHITSNNNIIWIANVQLESMWGSLRLAPIIKS